MDVLDAPEEQPKKTPEQTMQEIGWLLANLLRDQHPGWGFMLLFYEFGPGGTLSYASNGSRADMVNVLKELLARPEFQRPSAPLQETDGDNRTQE
jgi:hypothetical protein